MTATTARKPLTETTWGTLSANHAYLSQQYVQNHATRLYWDDLHDLAGELAELNDNLSKEQAQVLVTGASTQLPVILTWTERFEQGTETTTDAVIVEYMSTKIIHIHRLGFSHMLHLEKVSDARFFQSEISFERAE